MLLNLRIIKFFVLIRLKQIKPSLDKKKKEFQSISRQSDSEELKKSQLEADISQNKVFLIV